MKISHSPRLIKNLDNSNGLLRLLTKNTEIPAKKLNAGAQKLVIQRVV
jgi:hypothetical protein